MLATCIECGCNDLMACEDVCGWIRHEGDVGVCSNCDPARWDAGARELAQAAREQREFLETHGFPFD